MHKLIRPGIAAFAVMALLFSSGSWAAESKEAATAEQLEELQQALVEGIGQQDWKLVDLSLQGFKAGGIKGDALDDRLKEAQYGAALAMLGSMQRARLKVWTLGARAQRGDDKARAQLREFAQTPAIKLEEYKQEDRNAHQEKLYLSTESLKCLAHLKDPLAKEIAGSWIKVPPIPRPDFKANPRGSPGYWFVRSEQQTRLYAATECHAILNPDKGLTALDKLLEVKEIPLANRATVFSTLVSKHSMDGEFSDEDKQAMRASLRTLFGEVNKETGRDTVMSLMGKVYSLGKDPEMLTTLDGVRTRLANDRLRKTFDMYVKNIKRFYDRPAPKPRPQKNTASKKPVKPPTVEGDF